MNNTNFTICKANQEQREYVFERVIIKDEEERKKAVVYVATDSDKHIIGRTVIKEKDVPAPISGKYWYIENLFVSPEYRRKGIASALVAEIKKQAEILEIVYLYGSANASVEASLFWLNQGFTMNAYGKRQEDSSKPLFFGNYFHYINYCIRRKSLVAAPPLYNVRKASPEEIQQVIDKFVTDEKKKSYFINKINDLLGYIATGESGNIQGAIIAFPDSMQAPLDCMNLWIHPFVEPEYRSQGLGWSLVYKMYQYAKENDIIQLTNVDTSEDNIGFWYKIGFDIFFWEVKTQTGKQITTAMVRVK